VTAASRSKGYSYIGARESKRAPNTHLLLYTIRQLSDIGHGEGSPAACLSGLWRSLACSDNMRGRLAEAHHDQARASLPYGTCAE
jgi:hypothetical protein